MKLTLVSSLLSLVLALITISPPPLTTAARESPNPVVDTTGKNLREESSYYIIPAHSNHYAGLAFASIGQECPLDVVEVDGYYGVPVSFYNANLKKGVVRTSTNLNIAFSTYTSCPQTTVWKLDDNHDNFVTTGGVIGNPGSETIRNWFKIEEYEESYKVVYCPRNVCASCSFQCRNIGIYNDGNGNKRLALTDVPYKVQFLKQ